MNGKSRHPISQQFFFVEGFFFFFFLTSLPFQVSLVGDYSIKMKRGLKYGSSMVNDAEHTHDPHGSTNMWTQLIYINQAIWAQHIYFHFLAYLEFYSILFYGLCFKWLDILILTIYIFGWSRLVLGLFLSLYK